MNWQIVITSSVIAAIVTALMSFFINIYLKKLDYKNEYYKKVIQKRIESYEFLENQIMKLKQATVDDYDGFAYHQIFAFGEKHYIDSMYPTIQASAYSLWIKPSTCDVFNKLKATLINISFSLNDSTDRNADLIKVGKKYYKELGLMRDELEECVRNDYLNLHDIEQFGKTFKSSNNDDKFIRINKNL